MKKYQIYKVCVSVHFSLCQHVKAGVGAEAPLPHSRVAVGPQVQGWGSA